MPKKSRGKSKSKVKKSTLKKAVKKTVKKKKLLGKKAIKKTSKKKKIVPAPMKRIPIAGSGRTALPGARVVGPADPNERAMVTVIIRRRPSSKGLTSMIDKMGARKPSDRKYLSREEFAARHGADPGDLKKMEAFAGKYGLEIVETNAAQRRVVLAGTVAALSAAFSVDLYKYEHPGGTYRGRTGPIHLPKDIAPVIEAVLGLDNRPQARPHMRPWKQQEGAAQPRADGTSYLPPQIAKLYDFPQGVNGSGQCIAIIELGGGYRMVDLDTYFSQLGIATPQIKSVSVDGANNQPMVDTNADGEVLLDIEVAGAVAPGAQIVVYFAPNTDAGFLDAIKSAVHDNSNKPSVISISWGGPEKGWTQQTMQAMDQAFQEAATLGVTVCCAAGDDGSSDLRPPEPDDGLLHVDFPASSPHSLACGGTRLTGSGNVITKEVVWNDGRDGGATGGGISDVFDLPKWQAGANVPPSANPGGRVGRGVPDVAGDADPVTGYQVLVDGQQDVIGGTSAVAPLWSGLIALLNQKIGSPVGYLNPALYGLPASSGAFHDITAGNNDVTGDGGAYNAGPGWDACTGWGSPDGAKMLNALSG
ncbi:MAG TPA: S53 family peptidase, partial [Nitrospirota bacterium]|nr:S53 family peptidase [Nitrospirota bacterium]